MSIKRYSSTADTTITNAYKSSLTTRGTGSNMGAADILEVFSLTGQESSGSVELSRLLIQFPVSGTATGEIKADRTAGTIPASGSVRFYLKLFNAKHGNTLPRDLILNVQAVSQSWAEGGGLDMENYTDIGVANWVSGNLSGSVGAPVSTKGGWDGAWGTSSMDQTTGYTPGGTYHTAAYDPGSDGMPMYTQTFTGGDEDLEVDVTAAVEEWVAGTYLNYGFGVHLTSSQEAYSVGDGTNVPRNLNGSSDSYYTKKFFSRTSDFFFKRPVLEARWNASDQDDRGAFYLSSSLATAADNLNTLFLYNYAKGQLKNIPEVGETGSIMVALYSGSATDAAPSGSKLELSVGGNAGLSLLYATGGYHDTGIYTASLAFTGSSALETIYDVWTTGTWDNHEVTQFFTGTVTPAGLTGSSNYPIREYITNVSNLKAAYTNKEKPRLRLFVRDKDWNPNIYTKSSTLPNTEVIEEAHYKVVRAVDGLEVVPYNTASNTMATKLSYDSGGNYFDLDMSMLDTDYMYKIYFAYNINGDYQEQSEIFKFRVEEK